MEVITRTVYGSSLQTTLLIGETFRLVPLSTLNEKFNIQSGILPNADSNPAMRYYCIGNGGHKLAVGAGGIAKPEPVQHIATDAANFNHIPFVLRLPANDLTPIERAKYALRRLETINGLQYVAYYLKRIDFTGVVVDMQYKTVADDGTVTTTEFQPSNSNLNPQPQQLANTGTNLTSGDYVTATAKVDLSFSAADCTELLNVATVKYNDDELAIVSEIGLVSGVDQMVSTQGVGNATFQFNECIAAQLMSFINTFYPVKYMNTGIDITLDVGATEPLFKLQSS